MNLIYFVKTSARIVILIALLFFAVRESKAQEWTITTYHASSAIAGWPTSYAVDNNVSTVWSSNMHPSANFTEWYAYWFGAFHSVNYVRLTPRFSGAALGFPRSFNIYWSDGAQWKLARSVVNMQQPYRNDDIVLAFPVTVNCDGIQISATALNADDAAHYVLQMTEFHAGYDVNLANRFQFISNNGAADQVEIQQLGAVSFDPTKIANWNYDVRNPIIEAKSGSYKNIYAPSAVYNGGTTWNVYFGGWDGSCDQHDRVSVTVTTDNFQTFGTHSLQIDNGNFQHVNNECVKKLSASDWRMVYTTFDGCRNKPGYATSTNGVSWTPSSGSTSSLLTMTGYPTWDADVNGSNVILGDGGQFHMYFTDFHSSPGMHYATSAQNVTYTYVGKKLTDTVICNDLQKYTLGSTGYYLWAYHFNGSQVWYSKSTSVSSPGVVASLFVNKGGLDKYITSIGWVGDGAKLIGAFYGASTTASLTDNKVFARWLQKKVTFSNASTLLAEQDANSTDTVRLYMAGGQSVESGKFQIYAEDGTTLIFTSPKVTVLSGDIWKYNK